MPRRDGRGPDRANRVRMPVWKAPAGGRRSVQVLLFSAYPAKIGSEFAEIGYGFTCLLVEVELKMAKIRATRFSGKGRVTGLFLWKSCMEEFVAAHCETDVASEVAVVISRLSTEMLRSWMITLFCPRRPRVILPSSLTKKAAVSISNRKITASITIW